ncbi:SRPBCC family protein [Nocardia sp. NBC_00511]|uniref:SRPBCC family protein n=1 Tax=Nocardia sp. NBC_00511 TaxID=2903591 RepID=UPI0030DF5FAF
MSRIFQVQSRTTIAAPPEQVFDTVVRPAEWPGLHPISHIVEVPDGELKVGTSFIETAELGGQLTHIVWRVDSLRRPENWMISGRIAFGPQFGDLSAVLTVVFSVTELDPGHSRLQRSMLTAVSSVAPLPDWFLGAFGAEALHDRYLVEVKARAESAQPR